MSRVVTRPCDPALPGGCWMSARLSASEPTTELACGTCASKAPLLLEGLSSAGGVSRCLACGHPELYRQKDFPKALGISIVVIAAVAAPFTPYYASLFAAALVDAVLYWSLPERLVCYVCGARHSGFADVPRHPRFDREIDERLKYGQRAVMGKPMREGGTANAPEPEH
ncbi:MAG: hypothetical protein FJ299_13280 [Planctomycetes bacterium]|nr:hypothetical protein [Planctomycetota bacterium]